MLKRNNSLSNPFSVLGIVVKHVSTTEKKNGNVPAESAEESLSLQGLYYSIKQGYKIILPRTRTPLHVKYYGILNNRRNEKILSIYEHFI